MLLLATGKNTQNWKSAYTVVKLTEEYCSSWWQLIHLIFRTIFIILRSNMFLFVIWIEVKCRGKLFWWRARESDWWVFYVKCALIKEYISYILFLLLHVLFSRNSTLTGVIKLFADERSSHKEFSIILISVKYYRYLQILYKITDIICILCLGQP